MATLLRAQVRIQNASTLPEDVVVNTFHFRSTAGAPATDATTADTHLTTLYQGMQEFASPALGDFDVTIYNLVDPEPRTPMGTNPHTWDTSGGTAMPNEVAVCASFHASPTSGVALGRRRGRIYLGPFNTGVMSTGTFGGIVNADFLDDMQNLWDQFFDNTSSGSCIWSVFSPTTAGSPPWSESELMASSFPVVGGHIDNAFDTMRSRGIGATDRREFPVV